MSETYTNLIEWSFLWAFFLLIIGSMFAEAAWLSKKAWTNFGKAFVFSALSSFIGFFVSSIVVFICVIALLPLMFDNTVQDSFQTHSGAIMIIGIFALLFTPVFLIICKRIFLTVLKIQTGKAAWLYALVSSILIIVVSFGVPVLLIYFIYR